MGRLTLLASLAQEARLTFADETGQQWLADASVLARRRRIVGGARSLRRGRMSDGQMTARGAPVDGNVLHFHVAVHELLQHFAVDNDALDRALEIAQFGHVSRKGQIRSKAADEERHLQIEFRQWSKGAPVAGGTVVQLDGRLFAPPAHQDSMPRIERHPVRRSGRYQKNKMSTKFEKNAKKRWTAYVTIPAPLPRSQRN